MSLHKPSCNIKPCLLALALVAFCSPPGASNVATYQGQERFLAAWWPGQVVLHVAPSIPREPDRGAGRTRTVRAFLVGEGKRVSIVAPTAGIEGAERLTVEFSNGERCEAAAVVTASKVDAPLTVVPFCKEPPASGWVGLKWDRDPELGQGRRAWLMERPATIQPGAPPPPPVAVQAFLGPRAAAPMASYWEIALKRAVGAPLLDESGRVICAVFRYPVGPAGPGLCVPFAVAFKGLVP
jgi:hypothetical protein